MNYTKKKKQNFSNLVKRTRASHKWRTRQRTKIKVGDVVENCALHIGRVVELDIHSGDMKVQSFFTGQIQGCDLYHCGIVRQTAKEIIHKIDVWEKEGKDGLRKIWWKSLGMSKEEIEQALKDS